MDVEGTTLSLKDLLSPPPVMPWREFADWIRMGNERAVINRNGLRLCYAQLAAGHFRSVLEYGQPEIFDSSSTPPRLQNRKARKRPCRSTWKASTPGGVAGLQTLVIAW